jgi:hypothetical protein
MHDQVYFADRFVITGPVMAFAQVSAADKDTVRTIHETVH